MQIQTRGISARKALYLALSFVILVLWLNVRRGRDDDIRLHSPTKAVNNTTPWRPPSNVSVVGVVFYGRRRFVDILDCYIRRNLVANGGILDSVLFLVNTEDQQDLLFLEDLVYHVPQYHYITTAYNRKHGYGPLYKHLIASNTIYIKLDDDLIWLDDDAIPSITRTLIAHPEAHAIVGNLINSATLSWLHYHNGAVHPYLPEPKPPTLKHHLAATDIKGTDWRPSKLPSYPTTNATLRARYNFTTEDAHGRTHHKTPTDIPLGLAGGAPFPNHRWLPLRGQHAYLNVTPIAAAVYDPFGRGWTSWAVGAQQLYSLLENIESGALSRYWFGDGEGVWNMQYERANVNLMAIWGSSVARMRPGKDDEEDLSVRIPKALGKREFEPFLSDFVDDVFGLFVNFCSLV